jgi:hypothetical protein
MKYGIDCGHNATPDTGAVGIKQEDVLTLAVGSRVMAGLRSLGHEVVNCTPTKASSVGDSLRQRCQIANSEKVDVFVSIHFNAFNCKAYGTEVYAMSNSGKTLAKNVINEICSLGFFNRGVKDGSHLYVLKNTCMPAILVECCFVDSATDMNLLNADTMAAAIVKGLTGQCVAAPAKSPDRAAKWQEFINVLKAANIPYPQLKPAQLAQAILESGRGTSELFLEHNNPYGLKWRREMSEIAQNVSYKAHDGVDDYCKFQTLEDAVKGYWLFIGRKPYQGWEQYSSPEDYLKFIVGCGYCPDKAYANKVISILPEARKLLH